MNELKLSVGIFDGLDFGDLENTLCLASKDVRDKLGVEVNDFVEISNAFGDRVIRKVRKVPREIVDKSKNVIWIKLDDARLLDLSSDDGVVSVKKSDSLIECPC